MYFLKAPDSCVIRKKSGRTSEEESNDEIYTAWEHRYCQGEGDSLMLWTIIREDGRR